MLDCGRAIFCRTWNIRQEDVHSRPCVSVFSNRKFKASSQHFILPSMPIPNATIDNSSKPAP